MRYKLVSSKPKRIKNFPLVFPHAVLPNAASHAATSSKVWQHFKMEGRKEEEQEAAAAEGFK
jgi:hypothetical protein